MSDRVCTACNLSDHRRMIGYHPDSLLPFHIAKEVCPSPAYPDDGEMIPQDDILDYLEEHKPDKLEAVKRLHNKVLSVNLNFSQILKVLSYVDEHGINSINGAIGAMIDHFEIGHIPDHDPFRKANSYNNFTQTAPPEPPVSTPQEQPKKQTQEQTPQEESEEIII